MYIFIYSIYVHTYVHEHKKLMSKTIVSDHTTTIRRPYYVHRCQQLVHITAGLPNCDREW